MVIFHWLGFASSHQYLAQRGAKGSPTVGGKQQSRRAGRGRGKPRAEVGEPRIWGTAFLCLPCLLHSCNPQGQGTQPFPLAHLASVSSSSLPLFSPYPSGKKGKCPIPRSVQELSYSSEKDSALVSHSIFSLKVLVGLYQLSGPGARRSNLGAWICPGKKG